MGLGHNTLYARSAANKFSMMTGGDNVTSTSSPSSLILRVSFTAQNHHSFSSSLLLLLFWAPLNILLRQKSKLLSLSLHSNWSGMFVSGLYLIVEKSIQSIGMAELPPGADKITLKSLNELLLTYEWQPRWLGLLAFRGRCQYGFESCWWLWTRCVEW